MNKYILLVSRVGAFAIDYILFYVLLGFTGKYGVIAYALLMIAFFFYRVITTSIWGSTLGMELLKIKLSSFGFRICLKREIMRFASAFFYIGYIYAIFDQKGRAFHDIDSNTMVIHKGSKEEIISMPFIIKPIIYIILFISVLRWSTFFIVNGIGNIGLKKICISDKYFQNFDGDNLISLSQKQLYNNTLGRKYTAVADIENKPYILKISNKVNYTEVYKLNIENSRMTGEFLYKINLPLQFINSGYFRNQLDLCGISPQRELVLIDENGRVFANSKISLKNILAIACGDAEGDRKSEIAVLDTDGNLEIFDYLNNKLYVSFNGKIGEDIIPEAFFLDKGIYILAKGEGKSLLYNYKFSKGKFRSSSKAYIPVSDISSMSRLGENILVSNINRTNMMMGFGKIQTFAVFKQNSKISRKYDFGNRPAARYAFTVENLEEVFDIDGDGAPEIITKSVDKNDVMGKGYNIEVWKLDSFWMKVNTVLTKLEGILFLR